MLVRHEIADEPASLCSILRYSGAGLCPKFARMKRTVRLCHGTSRGFVRAAYAAKSGLEFQASAGDRAIAMKPGRASILPSQERIEG